MINSKDLIKSINNKCHVLFDDNFYLIHYLTSNNLSIYRNQDTSKALNKFKENELVDVLKWFDDFWLFLEIRFIKNLIFQNNKKIIQINTYISFSIFQGKENDNYKIQLFRAEWDDNNNPSEIHAQPHWHITSNQALEKTLEEFITEDSENNELLSYITGEKNKIKDINEIHFAMNGNWQNDNTHVHLIDNEDKIVKWILGLLKHIKTELE